VTKVDSAINVVLTQKTKLKRNTNVFRTGLTSFCELSRHILRHLDKTESYWIFSDNFDPLISQLTWWYFTVIFYCFPSTTAVIFYIF